MVYFLKTEFVTKIFEALEGRTRDQSICQMDLLINVDDAFLKVFHETVFHYLTDECPNNEEVDQYSAKLYERINKLGLVITLAVL